MIIVNLVATALFSLVGIACVGASVLDQTRDAVGQDASGWITGITGSQLVGTVERTKPGVSLGQRVAVAEELRTGQDDLLEILWARRAMILVRPQSMVTIHESGPGQTVVSLGGGSVRVALAYHGTPTDMVTVQTPRIWMSFPPAPSLLSSVASVFAKTDVPLGAARVETGPSVGG